DRKFHPVPKLPRSTNAAGASHDRSVSHLLRTNQRGRRAIHRASPAASNTSRRPTRRAKGSRPARASRYIHGRDIPVRAMTSSTASAGEAGGCGAVGTGAADCHTQNLSASRLAQVEAAPMPLDEAEASMQALLERAAAGYRPAVEAFARDAAPGLDLLTMLV